MCAIVGAVLRKPQKYADVLLKVLELSRERGSDSYGHVWLPTGMPMSRVRVAERPVPHKLLSAPPLGISTFIAQLRAEPTHEYIESKQLSDVAPFNQGEWWVAHNGTVANDLTYSLPANRRTSIDSEAIANRLAEEACQFDIIDVAKHMYEVQGSFAVLIGRRTRPGQIIVATNFKPLYYLTLPDDDGYIFASQESYLRDAYEWNLCDVRAVPQYTVMKFIVGGGSWRCSLKPGKPSKVLMLCSGGLDAAVAATILKREQKLEVTLLNYCYGQRAQGREAAATKSIAEALECEWKCKSLDLGVQADSSTLLDPSKELSRGASGAEMAHEWVPARNLLLISHAVALAEATAHDAVALGINLEESNSYPDNEMEFVHRFNELLPYAVAPNKRVQLLMPVGSMMKRQIVERGQLLNAPMEQSYSCYSGSETHCGLCASCYLRRTAFKIAAVHDPTTYL